jgi:hypothetical protein
VFCYRPHDPLFTRGWALQELLLSPRVLLFDEIQMGWQCQTEEFKQMVQSHIDYDFVTKRLPSPLFGVRQHGNTVPRKQQLEVWSRLVMEYSGRDLSDFGDRLSAIAGIATELGAFWRDKYLAGLWSRILLPHLGWCRNPTKANIESHNKGARIGPPSWSWVSAPFRVYFTQVGFPKAEVIDCWVHPVSAEAPFGQVKEGYLKISAKLLVATTVNFPSWQSTYDYDQTKVDTTTHFLLLGKSPRKHNVVLILRQIDDQSFERIGHNYYSPDKIWASVEEKTIILK